ncbi:MAG TPA: hypothetical protein PKJ75_05920 [Methanosarcina vacuolata]|nr:hypothetical protein [Methanosarcina vacuolata]
MVIGKSLLDFGSARIICRTEILLLPGWLRIWDVVLRNPRPTLLAGAVAQGAPRSENLPIGGGTDLAVLQSSCRGIHFYAGITLGHNHPPGGTSCQSFRCKNAANRIWTFLDCSELIWIYLFDMACFVFGSRRVRMV